MLTMIDVITSQGTTLSLSLADASSGLVLQEVLGLDPVKATLVSSGFANLDGEQYQSSRRETRNIKLKLGLEPDFISQSVQGLRTLLYQFLMPKSEVTLRFYLSEGLIVDIMGRVESFESALFTKEPIVDISLMCFDPDFYDPTAVSIDLMSTNISTETSIVYGGSVETGIVFTVNADRSLPSFTFYQRLPDNTFRFIEFFGDLISGDILTISTVTGSKSCILLRGGIRTSLLYGISPQSNWIEFVPGDNNIRLYAEGAAIPFTIDYMTKYGGL